MTTDQPLEAVNRLEARLADKGAIRCYVRIRSGELVTTHFKGSVELGPSRSARLYLRGEWENARATVESSPDGQRLVGNLGEREIDAPMPDGIRDFFAVGFVRVGLLDTLFRMVGADRSSSGDELRRRVRLDALALLEPDAIRSDLSACLGHAFAIRDRGRDVGTATLWIDRFEGLPQERSQSARTAVSMMTTEQYWDWED